MVSYRVASALVAVVIGLTGCDARHDAMSSADSQAAHAREVVAAGGVVDSILPIEEQLRRFRETVSERPDSLRHASASIDALVRRWARAISTRDTVTLQRMALDRAEFAWLYYPGSRLSQPPYEAPPQLVWGQVMESSDKGARRLLERFGATRFEVRSVRCPAPSDTTAVTLVHDNCTVQMTLEGGRTTDDRFFGSIIEHQGRFKFLGYANKL